MYFRNRNTVKRNLTRSKEKKLRLQAKVGEINNILKEVYCEDCERRRQLLLNEIHNLDGIINESYFYLRSRNNYVC